MRRISFLTLCYFIGGLCYGQSDPKEVCQLFLQAISVSKGQEVNWDQLRDLFCEGATFTFPVSDSSRTISFDQFRKQSSYHVHGFQESAIAREVFTFGRIAQVVESFQAQIQAQDVQFQGINCYQLVREGTEWRIAHITYEIEQEAWQIPASLHRN